MAEYRVLVLSNCERGREVEYNEYYDTQHIPDILREMPEVQAAQRFQLAPIMSPEGIPEWRFSCLYTVETDDFQSYLDRMQRALEANKIPPSGAATPGTAAVFKLVPLGGPITRIHSEEH